MLIPKNQMMINITIIRKNQIYVIFDDFKKLEQPSVSPSPLYFANIVVQGIE